MQAKYFRRILVLSDVVLALTAGAQQPASAPASAQATAAVNPAPVAPFADSIQTLDMPGFRNFPLPQTAGQCVAAVLLAKHESRIRDFGRDTLPAPIPDTLPPAVRTIGEACRAHVAPLPSGNTTAPELQSAFELAVVLGDSTGSLAALDSWLAAPPTLLNRGESAVDTRIGRLRIAAGVLLNTEQTGVFSDWAIAQAKTFVARFDAIGPAAHAARLLTQADIIRAETEWRNQKAGKFTAPERVLHDWLALIPAFDSADAQVLQKYIQIGGGGVGLYPVPIEHAQNLIDDGHTMALLDSLATHSTIIGDAAKEWAMGRKRDRERYLIGHPVPKLQARFWYSMQGDSVWPVPGHVSLLLVGELPSDNTHLIQYLVHRYSAKGLRITVVDKTKGYWLRGGTETGPRTAAQEAAQDSAYYLSYRKLPITLAIQEAQFARIPPNGFYEQSGPVQYERDFIPLAGYSRGMVLTDANGMRLDTFYFGDPAYMIARLDQMLGVHAP